MAGEFQKGFGEVARAVLTAIIMSTLAGGYYLFSNAELSEHAEAKRDELRKEFKEDLRETEERLRREMYQLNRNNRRFQNE